MLDSNRQLANYQVNICLILWILAGCAGYTASVLYTANAQEAIGLAKDFPQHWPPLGEFPTAFAKLRGLLIGLALLFGLLGVLVSRSLASENLLCSSWRNRVQRIWASLFRGWWALRPQQRRWALVGLFFVTALRITASLIGVNVDDVASYEYFVRKSLLTVIAYYPAPNNHLLSNVISWFFYQVYPGYWWSMRLPVLLLSTIGTIGWFLGLLHRINFRVAALTITLFSLLETSLFAAALGRGYTLVMVFSGLGFFSMLLLEPVMNL